MVFQIFSSTFFKNKFPKIGTEFTYFCQWRFFYFVVCRICSLSVWYLIILGFLISIYFEKNTPMWSVSLLVFCLVFFFSAFVLGWDGCPGVLLIWKEIHGCWVLSTTPSSGWPAESYRHCRCLPQMLSRFCGQNTTEKGDTVPELFWGCKWF